MLALIYQHHGSYGWWTCGFIGCHLWSPGCAHLLWWESLSCNDWAASKWEGQWAGVLVTVAKHHCCIFQECWHMLTYICNYLWVFHGFPIMSKPPPRPFTQLLFVARAGAPWPAVVQAASTYAQTMYNLFTSPKCLGDAIGLHRMLQDATRKPRIF